MQDNPPYRGMESQGTTTEPEKVVTAVQRVTLWGLAVNIMLSALKFTVGIMGGSQAIVADAIHSLSDTTTDLAVLFGVRFWTAPADDHHPYGHWRIETIITTCIGISLATVAIGISYNAITTLHTRGSTSPHLIALIGAIASIISKEILYRWTLKVGRATRSPAVIANAWHHRTDALSSIPAALAVLLARISPDWAFADHIGAIVVSGFVLHAAWGITRRATADLLDKAAPPSVKQEIEAVALRISGVETVHKIRTRAMGPGIYLDLHVLVNGDLTVREGHDISETVRQALLKDGPAILDVVVHLEPAAPKPIH
jgi:cation diffusion facilitator family transporter